MGIKKLQTQIIISIVGVVIFSIISAFITLNSMIKSVLERDLEEFAVNMLELTVKLVDSRYTDILTFRETALSGQREEMEFYSNLVFTLLNTIYERVERGELTEKEAKSEAALYLSKLKFYNNVDYFWIRDNSEFDPEIIFHPLVSGDFGNGEYNTLHGVPVEKEKYNSDNFFDRTNNYTDGYWEYTEENQKKITYVRTFKPWNWTVGAESSPANIEKKIDEKLEDILLSVVKTVGSRKFGGTGSFFVFDEYNKILLHPGYTDMDGNKLLDPGSDRILMNEFKEVLKNGGNSMLYLWNKPGDEDNFTYEKKAFFTFYEPLGWYIAGSVYVQDFMRSGSEQNRIFLFIFIIFLLLSLFLAMLVSKSVVAPLNNIIKEIGKTDVGGTFPKLISQTGPYEIQLLKKTINTMIDSVKISQLEKEKLQEELIHRGKMDAIGQLAGGIAHDFNNMLSGIMGAAQLLNSPKRGLDGKSKKLVDLILVASGRASELTSKLLTIGSQGGFLSELVDIHSVIEETLSLLEKTINNNIRIVMGLSAASFIVRGNRSAIYNIMVNIGINAAEAMPDGGVLSIGTKNIDLDDNFCRESAFDIVPGKYIQIDLSDTGCGIKKENIKKIFEPFFTTRISGKGTGLGLSTVYTTVEGHRGAIDVVSELRKGTLFRIYLPSTPENRMKKIDSHCR